MEVCLVSSAIKFPIQSEELVVANLRVLLRTVSYDLQLSVKKYKPIDLTKVSSVWRQKT